MSLRSLAVAAASLSLCSCSQPEPEAPQLAEVLELLREQQEALSTLRAAGPGGIAIPPAQQAGTPPLPQAGPPPGAGAQAAGAPGQPPRPNIPGAQMPAGHPGGPSPLLYAMPGQAESDLGIGSNIVLGGTAWSLGPSVPPFLRDREVPDGSFLTYLDSVVQLHTPEGVYAYDIEYWPGDLLCRRLRPCIAVTNPDGRVFPMWYEVSTPRDGEDRRQRMHFLDCIRIEEAEGGAFPSDELLEQNGGLRAVHRTATQLCVRPIADQGLPALTLGDDEATQSPATAP